MFKKNNPGCACCCPCWEDVQFTTWAQESGKWTISGDTATITAGSYVLTSPRTDDRFQYLFLSLASLLTDGDKARVGWKDTSGNAIYVEAEKSGTNRLLSIYSRPLGGPATLLSGPHTNPVGDGGARIYILLDDEYARFTLWRPNNSIPTPTCWKVDISDGDYYYYTPYEYRQAFIETDTADAAVFTIGSHRNCLCRACPPDQVGVASINYGPSEFEVSVSGVTGVNPQYFNGDYVLIFNGVKSDCVWRKYTALGGLAGYVQHYAKLIYYATNQTLIRVGISHSSGTAVWEKYKSGRIDGRTINESFGPDELVSNTGSKDASAAAVTLVANP